MSSFLRRALAVLLTMGMVSPAAAGERFYFRYVSGTFQKPSIPAEPNGPQSDQSIDAAYIAIVGEPFSAALPTRAGEVVSSWRIESGSLPSGLSFDQNTLTFSGTPTARTKKSLVLGGYSVDGARGTDASVSFEVIEPGAGSVTTQVYAHTGRYVLSALPNPGNLPVSHWSLLSPLPDGFTLKDTGHISGTAAAPGTWPIVISGANHLGDEIRFVSGQILVEDGPVIEPISDSFVHPGDQVSAVPVVKHAIGELRWQLEGDALPRGLTFSPTSGSVYGSPQDYNINAKFRIRAFDTDGTNGISNEFTIATDGPDVAMGEAGDRTAVVGQYTGFGFSATDLSGSKTWSLNSGTLPAGLSLDSATGRISGVPSQIGEQEGVSVKVSTSDGGEDSTNPFRITVVDKMISPSPQSFQYDVRTGQQFQTDFIAMSNGTAPYGFEMAEGAPLPSGWTLDPGTGQVSGVTAVAERNALPIVSTDSEGRKSATFTVSVQSYNPLGLTMPDTIEARRLESLPSQVQPIVAPDSVITDKAHPFPSFSAVGSWPAGISVDSQTGALEGKPTEEGPFTGLAVRISDASGASASSNPFSIHVGPRQPLTVSAGAVSIPRLVQFSVPAATAAHAVGETTFTLASGTLPEGVTLEPNGKLSGLTQVTDGFGPLRVTATDSEGMTATSDPFNVTVTLPDLQVSAKGMKWRSGKFFLAPAAAVRDSIGSYSFSASGLPAGVTIDPASGALSGVVAEPGEYTVEVSVTDSYPRTATRRVDLEISPPMTVTAAPSYSLHRASSEAITPQAHDPIGQAAWAVSGTLPDGLAFSPYDGSLTGTPTKEGTWNNIKVTATDASGTQASATFGVTVGAPKDLEVKIDPTVSVYLNDTRSFPKSGTAVNAVGKVTWQSEGSLPPGVAFNPQTGAYTGKATEAGTYPGITVTATDSEGRQASASFSFRVTWQDNMAIGDPVRRTIREGVWSRTEGVSPKMALSPLSFEVRNGATTHGLTLDPATGSVSGMLSEGVYTIPMKATDALGRSADFTLELKTVGPLALSAPSATQFNQHFPKSVTFTTTNAVGTPSYSLEGTLPPGLSFNASNGTISGTPTEMGTWSGLSVTVTDFSGATARTAAFSMTVAARLPLSVNAISSTSAIATKSFSLTPKAVNPVGSVTWSMSGTLPPGLSVDPVKGTLSGTPTTLGTYSGIQFVATDSLGAVAHSATFSISVITNGQPIGLTVYGLTGKVGYPFATRAPVVTNNVGDITFQSLDVDASGLSLDTRTGIVSGTVSTPSTIPLNVYVTDSSNRLTSRMLTVEVLDHLKVVSPEYADLTVNANANAIVSTPSNAIGTVTWSLEGALPVGLTFSPSNGMIYGKPTQLGEFRGIFVSATDSLGDVGRSGEMTIVVHDSGILPTVKVTAPSSLVAGTAYSIQPVVTDGKYGDIFETNIALPDGLSLDPATGRISGTPTNSSPGIYENLTVTLTTVNGITVQSNPVTLKVAYRNYFSFQTLAQASRRNVPFTSTPPQLAAAAPGTIGTVGTVTFAKSGTWPATLDLDPHTGVVTGTLSTGGSWTIIATDAITSRNFSFTYNAMELSVKASNVAQLAGSPVSTPPPTVAHSSGSVSYSLVGTLPAGLTFNPSNGTISGVMPSSAANGLQIVATDDFGSAASNLFSFLPSIVDPTQFSLTGKVGVEPMSTVISDAVRIYGINAPAPVTVSPGADFRICAGAGTGCSDWIASGTAATVEWGEWLQVRTTASPSFLSGISKTLAVGGVSSDFIVTTRSGDTTPKPFAFVGRVSLEPSVSISSNIVRIYDITDPAPVSISGGAEFRVCQDSLGADCGNWSTSGSISNLQYLQLRTSSPSQYSTTGTATVDVGGVTSDWKLTTRPTEATPIPFAFDSRTQVEPSTEVVSDPVRIYGNTDPAEVSVSAQGEFRICTTSAVATCGAWISAGSISANQFLQLRTQAPAGWEASSQLTVSVGTGSATWTVTTRAQTTLSGFSFASVTNAELNQSYKTDWVRVSGLAAPASLSVSGSASYRLCEAANAAPTPTCENRSFTSSSTTIPDGTWVQGQIFSISGWYDYPTNGSISIGGVVASWSVTTRSKDAVPDPFSFASVANAERGQPFKTDWVRITGLADPAPLSVSGGASFRLCEAANAAPTPNCEIRSFTSSSTTIPDGTWVQGQITSNATYNDWRTDGSISIGGVVASWSVTTRSKDAVPDPFSFASILNAERNTPYDTDWVRITGLADSAPLSISGAASYRTCDAIYEDPQASCGTKGFTATSTTIPNGVWVQGRIYSNPTYYNWKVDGAINIGGVIAPWSVTTKLTP